MKTTFIYFGILVAMYSSNSFAKDLAYEQNYQESDFLKTELISESVISLKKPIVNLELDTDVSKAILAISSNYKKSIEEIIKEDNQIIESEIDNNSTITNDRTVEEIIKEDNQIIESTISTEVFPLDFNMINKSVSRLKKEEFNNQLIDKNTLKS